MPGADKERRAPRTLLFDLDGTLTDNFQGIASCIRHALARMDISDPGEHALRACVGPPLRQTFPRLLGRDDAASTERAVSLYRERFAEVGWRENRVYPGITEMLATAARDSRKVLLCTTKPQFFAEKIVAHFGLADHFDAVYGTSLDGRFDDKADLMAYLLASEGMDGESCLMIGDRMHDVHAARRNGVPSIGVLWGYGSRAELEDAGATALIAAPEDLWRGLASVQAASS